MEKLKVDLSEIASAMDGDYGGDGSVLDLKTGKVIYLSDDYFDALSPEDLGITSATVKKLKKASSGGDLPAGFVHIPARDSRDGFRWMREFVDAQSGEAARILGIALEGPKPFRRFKDAMDYLEPEVLKAWYDYKNEREEAAVVEWLDEEGIEYEPG